MLHDRLRERSSIEVFVFLACVGVLSGRHDLQLEAERTVRFRERSTWL